MTWCARIYDIFNGWSEEENQFSIANNNEEDKPKFKQLSAEFYKDETEDNNKTIIQHDSPFLEKSDSFPTTHLTTKQLYNDDYLNRRDYQGEHICVDTHFSCHQRDEQYYYDAEDRPYGIATISNMSLNLPKYFGNTENIQQQLSRSFSLDLPMDIRRNAYTIPSFSDISPHVRYSTTQQINQAFNNKEKPNRLSLNLGSSHNSQASLERRQDAFGYRVSTRSTYSVQDNANNELQSPNNEEIEQEVQYRTKEMLTSTPGGVFPMIYCFPDNEKIRFNDRYRIEGGYGEPSQWSIQTKILPSECCLISENISSIYLNDFYDQYHVNLYAIDNESSPVVMSVKPYDQHLKVIVRTKEGSKCMVFIEHTTNSTDYVNLSKEVYPNLHIGYFENCTNLKAQDSIKSYDEKLETQKFKFGVIYQRRGQTTEEEFFNNQTHNRSFDEFLDIIASKVSLKNFKGYRGGLDVSEQTDSPVSYYECYDQKEIMFHVSTLLPYTNNDTTQIQRKRHIGNDIVTIVFQEENTPFHPSMIKSNFLHAFLVIQPAQILSRPCYKIMFIAREDIQEFPPNLQKNVVYIRTAEQLKPFILSKLINAEYAAYRCRTFALLQERTRCSFLKNLCENLSDKSFETLCDEQKQPSHRRSTLLSNSTRKRYLSSMKKIFSRSNSTPDGPRQSIKSDSIKIKPSKKLVNLGKSMDSADSRQRSLNARSPIHQDIPRENKLINRHMNARSDDSLNSSGDITSSTMQNYSSNSQQMYHGDESDEGLDSMSSADAARLPYDSDDQDAYRQQIREKSHPSQIWHRVSTQRHIYTPQTAGIHISEEATV
ncbi:unnamed protein product [Rotaria socialis]|uniref:Rap-GAP domain-containing protein n=1 Tax=Rotaria socialis TaxID=392032 RepID=A0A821JDN6_9BILA|nr:unnamed protein product [Rotaria socialis]CAF4716477.1 unnamed protein product [Rotaria socialis]